MAQEDLDTESGLPETVSLSSSASAAKGHDRALRNFHAAEKRKIREKNRLRDERLKAQAHMRRRITATTGKGRLYVGNHGLGTRGNEGGREMDPRPHSRMTRAMGDAEEEMEEMDSASASEDEWGGIKSAYEEDSQVATGQNVEMLRSEGEDNTRHADLDAGEGRGDDNEQSLAPLDKYLPDHVFVAALSNPKPKNDVRPSQTTPKTRSSSSNRNRQSVRTRTKDVVVGTRIVRTLLSFPASARLQSTGTTLPPARIKKFLTNALGLKKKGNKVSTSTPRWERRPSHLGVMKRTTGAPMTGFARTSQH